MVLEVTTDSLSDSDTAGPSTEEDDLLVLEGNFGDVESTNRSREDDGSGALDVVVETGVDISMSRENGEGEGGVEIFELDDLLNSRLVRTLQ